MTTPTVASLCRTLGHHLTPVDGFSATEVEISAVHISELLDPTVYLSGGELLLTTGLTLPRNQIGCSGYVARLVEARVGALALGLGPVHLEPPEVLVRACRDAALPLLTVPGPTPFLLITKAYWTARSRSTERRLTDAVAGHRALVDAAVAPDPAASILRRLARLIDGWAALLGTSGAVDHVYPAAMTDLASVLRAEVGNLGVAGVHSSASFAVGQHNVVVYPLAVQNRIVGYLAAGTPQQLEPAQRRVVLTASALLSLDAVREQRTASARDATRRCIALLADLGMVDAARRLAAETGDPAPRREVAVLAVRVRDGQDAVREVADWCPDALAVRIDRSSAWFLLPDDHSSLMDLKDRLRRTDPDASAAASELVAVERLGPTRTRLLQALRRMKPGDIDLPRPGRKDGLGRAVDEFLTAASVEVRDSLVAYLRHRGQWEQASKALGLHRNTVRYRVSRARELVGLDLDDPDVAAEVWLALRARGVA